MRQTEVDEDVFCRQRREPVLSASVAATAECDQSRLPRGDGVRDCDSSAEAATAAATICADIADEICDKVERCSFNQDGSGGGDSCNSSSSSSGGGQTCESAVTSAT